MAIPDYETLMLPVLKTAGSDAEVSIRDCIDRLATDFKLSESERQELLPSGKQTTFANRVHWARTYLVQAGLLEATRRAQGLDAAIASPSHRALPDAYVTAFILREPLELATVEELIAWTTEPALLSRITFGRHRGSRWETVPSDYLAWVADRSELGEDVKFTAERHRRLRLEQARAT